MKTRQPHVLVVTATENHTAEDPDVEYAIECPGDGGCPRTWYECTVVPQHDVDEVRDTGMAHGVEHQVFQGVACTETDRCYVQEGFAYANDGSDISITPGRFPVDYDGGDLDDFYLIALTEERTP